MPTSKNSDGYRLDPLNCTVWAGVVLLVVAFWAWAVVLLWPTVQDALSAAGVLNDCRALYLGAAECMAFAQEGR